MTSKTIIICAALVFMLVGLGFFARTRVDSSFTERAEDDASDHKFRLREEQG